MKIFSDLLFIAALVMAFQELAADQNVRADLLVAATMFLSLLLGWSYEKTAKGTIVSGSRIADLKREGVAIATLYIFMVYLQEKLLPAYVSAVMGSWALYAVGRIFSRSMWLIIGVALVVAIYMNNGL